MAKGLRSKGYYIYPYLGIPTGKNSTVHYVNIRITNKKAKPIFIGVYTKDKERVKCEKKNWNVDDQKITGGFSKDKEKIDQYNNRISDLLTDIEKIISKNTIITKDVIEDKIYGEKFLTSSKNKRVNHVSIPIYQRSITLEFQEIYNQLHQSILKIQQDESTDQEINEAVTDFITELALVNIFRDPNIEEFFKGDSLPFEAFDYIKRYNTTFASITDLSIFKRCIDAKRKYPKLANDLVNNFQRNNNIPVSNAIFKYDVEKYVNLSKKEVQEFAKSSGKNQPSDSELINYKRSKENVEEKSTLAPIDIYTKNKYNKNNIFEVAGQILFLNKKEGKPFSDNWKMAIMKLYDYRSRATVSENIKSFNLEWVHTFIKFIKKEGYSTAHPKNFNPFNYKPEMFLKGTGKYNDLSLQKFVKNTKEVFKYLIDNNHLPLIAIDKIDYSDYGLSNVKQDTMINFYLYKNEIDKLFYHKFDKAELNQARDLFILQYYFGGLRPKEELLLDGSVKLLKDESNKYKVSYVISKETGETNENPVCTYSQMILGKYDFDYDKVKEGFNYERYSKALKEIGKAMFDRKIIKFEQINGKIKQLETNIKSEFTAYFARRSFEMTLSAAGVNQADTSAFTGRKMNLGSLKNYRHYTYQEKRTIMEGIKPEK